jgi:hypothetical protein
LIANISLNREMDGEHDQPDQKLIRACSPSTLPPEASPPFPE